MIGIIIIGHGNFADGLLGAAEMIIGKQKKIKALSLMPTDNPEEFRKKLKEKVKEMNDNNGILILADMFGGTPANAANYLLEEKIIEKMDVVTGVNMPLTIELINLRHSTNELSLLISEAKKIFNESFKILSELD